VDNDTSSVSIVIAIPPGLPNLPRPLDPAFLPSIQHCPRRQTTTCTPPSRRTQTVGRGIPGSGKAHRSTACGADAPRCVRSPFPVPHSSPCIYGEERRQTTYPWGKRERFLPANPLNQYSTSSAPTANILTILSGPRARVSALWIKQNIYVFAGNKRKKKNDRCRCEGLRFLYMPRREKSK